MMNPVLSSMRRLLSASVSILLFSFALGAAKTATAEFAADPSLEDFSVGRSLIVAQPGLLQSVLLDFDVYRRSVEPGLADLRVFDGQGEPTPYAIRRRLPGTMEAPVTQSVPIFRLDSEPGGSRAIVGAHTAGGYRIDAEISESGAILSIRGSDREVGLAKEAVAPSTWLLDTSGLTRPIVHLDFVLAESEVDFVSRLRLESSDDLSSFRAVNADLALARLDQAGHHIERMSFAIPATRARYLRLSPTGAGLPVEIREVRVRLSGKTSIRRHFRKLLEGRWDPNEPGVVLFDLEASPPIETIRVLLGQQNSIVEGQLESAPRPDGPWRSRQSGVFYFYDRGGALRNPATSWNGSRDRYLRLVTSTRGGGLKGHPLPTLEVVWQPEQLLYLERSEAGPGGSTLAVGRVDTLDGSFPASDLLRMGRSAANDPDQITVRLGPERILAGDAALERSKPPPPPTPWRTYGLWALLLSIVAVVLGMSFRLMQNVED